MNQSEPQRPAALTAGAIGRPLNRIEGHAKVTGAAIYPSDEPLTNPAFAYLVTSTIARGRIVRMHFDKARAVTGVIDILWRGNVGSEAKPPPAVGGRGKSTTTLESDQIWHIGQIIAVIVANTLEAAREAGHLIETVYQAEVPAATFGSAGAHVQALAEATAKDARRHADINVGDAQGTFGSAPVKVEASYSTPTQHHNALELFTTTCQWQGGKLTIYESSQFVHGLRAEVAGQLGISPDDVRIVSRHVGGGFGGRSGVTSRTAWIAIAARRLKRPVKLEATRKQGFTIATYRAETRHQVRLAADRDGRLLALLHESWEATSRPSTYTVSGTDTVGRLYTVPNISTKINVVQLDRNTPGYMRAPPETPYLFALESAMDELAYALKLDPVALRRINDAQRDSVRNLAYTSRHLNECFEEGARVFGWSGRAPQPGLNARRGMAGRLWLRREFIACQYRGLVGSHHAHCERSGQGRDCRARLWQWHLHRDRASGRRSVGGAGRLHRRSAWRQRSASGRLCCWFQTLFFRLQRRGQGLRATASEDSGGSEQCCRQRVLWA